MLSKFLNLEGVTLLDKKRLSDIKGQKENDFCTLEQGWWKYGNSGNVGHGSALVCFEEDGTVTHRSLLGTSIRCATHEEISIAIKAGQD